MLAREGICAEAEVSRKMAWGGPFCLIEKVFFLKIREYGLFEEFLKKIDTTSSYVVGEMAWAGRNFFFLDIF